MILDIALGIVLGFVLILILLPFLPAIIVIGRFVAILAVAGIAAIIAYLAWHYSAWPHFIVTNNLQITGTSSHSSIFFLSLTILMALVLFFDASRYIIPNWVVGIMLMLYPVMVFTLPSVDLIPILISIGVMLLTFAIGYLIYTKHWMGGGDIKLLCACALWCGPREMLDLLLLMAILGGLLALALIVGRKALLYTPVTSGSLPRILQQGAPLPYGLAIAAAFLILLWQQKLPGLVFA